MRTTLIESDLTILYLLWMFDYDREKGVLTWRDHWGPVTRSRFVSKEAGTISKCRTTSYRRVKINNKSYRTHRIIWFLEKGVWPEMIDHIDGDGLNNQIDNLRDVIHRLNHHNNSCHRKGKLVGTHLRKDTGRWNAQICIKGKVKYLGCYDTELEAHQVYMNALKETDYE